MIKYKFLHNFLSSEDNKELLEYALNIKDWTNSTITNTSENYRKSRVYYYMQDDVKSKFLTKISSIYPELLSELDITDTLDNSNAEIQLTYSNDGDFFKAHPDSDAVARNIIGRRRFTFVYYMNNEPKNYTGGTLRIYDVARNADEKYNADVYEDIQPENNSILFFPSYYWHEVLEVKCESNKFEDSRFTINGWYAKV